MSSNEALNPTTGYSVVPVPKSWCKDLILNVHYAKRMPPISFSYGLFRDGFMVGVCTFGSPANNHLCRGICGETFKDSVIELNRLVLSDNLPNEASRLVGGSLKLLPGCWVVVSYADTSQGHEGTIYKATNWIFTGTTKERSEFDPQGRHARHYKSTDPHRIRSAKHRYVKFVGDKRWKRKAIRNLKYPVLPYATLQRGE